MPRRDGEIREEIGDAYPRYAAGAAGRGPDFTGDLDQGYADPVVGPSLLHLSRRDLLTYGGVVAAYALVSRVLQLGDENDRLRAEIRDLRAAGQDALREQDLAQYAEAQWWSGEYTRRLQTSIGTTRSHTPIHMTVLSGTLVPRDLSGKRPGEFVGVYQNAILLPRDGKGGVPPDNDITLTWVGIQDNDGEGLPVIRPVLARNYRFAPAPGATSPSIVVGVYASEVKGGPHQGVYRAFGYDPTSNQMLTNPVGGILYPGLVTYQRVETLPRTVAGE